MDTLRLLRTCGMATFVEYYDWCKKNPGKTNYLAGEMQEKHGYASNSALTKANTLYRIIREKRDSESLTLIVKSSNTPAAVVRKARELREQYFSPTKTNAPAKTTSRKTPPPTQTEKTPREKIEKIQAGYAQLGYVSDEQIATALFLAQRLEKPLLVEGPPGVGKTELAKATAEYLDLPLIRLQCYEGLDESKALYEWQYGKQLLYTQVLKEKLGDLMDGAATLDESMTRLHDFEDVFFSKQFLLTRPLLQALESEAGVVLLVDEIDKSDDEFEAFLLEILSDYQISVPELGTIKAKTPPLVFLTSNNTREIGDALKRRCLHLYIPFPDAPREKAILCARVPQLDELLRTQVVDFVQGLRALDLKKPPAVSEAIDWAQTVVLLNIERLDENFVRNTLNVLLKFKSDIDAADAELTRLMRETHAVAAS